MAGLTVTVSPSASAFFAGEVFTATITFRNSATPLPEPLSSYGDENGGNLAPHPTPTVARLTPGQRTPGKGHARAASTAAALSNWAGPPNGAVPQTPSRGGGSTTNAASSGAGGGGAGGLHAFASPPNSAYGRTVSSGHAPHPSLSASASTSHLPTLGSPSSRQPSFAAGRSLSRSPSTGSFSIRTLPGSYDPDAAADLPARKGLIGKPLTTSAEPPLVASSSGGLYSGGPRRPGLSVYGNSGRGHARTQSMAAAPLKGRTESPQGSQRIPGMRSATAPIRPGAPRRSNSVRGLVAAFEQMDGRQPQSPTGPRGPSLLLRETGTA